MAPRRRAGTKEQAAYPWSVEAAMGLRDVARKFALAAESGRQMSQFSQPDLKKFPANFRPNTKGSAR
jgi:hypothetical protein